MKPLTATSDQLKALVVAFLAVALREPGPPLQEVDLEAILILLVGYVIGRRIAQAGQTRKPRSALVPVLSQMEERRP